MLGVRLDPRLEEGLDRVARRQGRSKSEIAREAVRRYVERHDEAFLAEARRQSRHAAQFDDPDDWKFWESLSAWDDDDK